MSDPTAPTRSPFVYAACLSKWLPLKPNPHDGDTIRLDIDLGFNTWRRDEVFRLLGVQAPEVSGPGVTKEEKAAGLSARDYLASLLVGRQFLIRTHKDKQDGRSRYLAEVWLEDGRSVALLMIEKGHATPYDGKGKAPKWKAPGVWEKA